MQISEELVRQIAEAVIRQMKAQNTRDGLDLTPSGNVKNTLLDLPDAAAVRKQVRELASGLGEDDIPSMAGRTRINERKTDYSSYPKAEKGTDPKEVVIGVGAAFQREI